MLRIRIRIKSRARSGSISASSYTDPDPTKNIEKRKYDSKENNYLFVIGFSLNYMKTIESFVRWVFNLLFVEGLFYCFLFIISCFVSF